MPQAFQMMEFLVGGDADVFPDWEARNVSFRVPVDVPLFPYIEKVVRNKFRGSSVDVDDCEPFLTASPSVTNPVRMANLGHTTAEELFLEGEQWVWLKKRAPELPASDFKGEEEAEDADDNLTPEERAAKKTFDKYLRRVKRFYTVYDPTKVVNAEYDMVDFKEREELLIAKLVTKYGPEPVPERTTGSGSNAKRVAQNFTSAVSKAFAMTLRMRYLHKWHGYLTERVFKRRDLHRVTTIVSGKTDHFARASTYAQWRHFLQIRKAEAEVAAANEHATKTEAFVGDLTAENANLRVEVKRLQSHVEVLEKKSAKKYEALYNSSEGAVTQLRRLTMELQQREMQITKLEAKLMKQGNDHLQVKEERDRAAKKVEAMEAEVKNVKTNTQADIERLEQQLHNQARETDVQRKVAESEREYAHKVMLFPGQRLPNDAPCMHCIHYGDVAHESEVQARRAEHALGMLEKSEESRRALTEVRMKHELRIAELQEECTALRNANRTLDGKVVELQQTVESVSTRANGEGNDMEAGIRPRGLRNGASKSKTALQESMERLGLVGQGEKYIDVNGEVIDNPQEVLDKYGYSGGVAEDGSVGLSLGSFFAAEADHAKPVRYTCTHRNPTSRLPPPTTIQLPVARPTGNDRSHLLASPISGEASRGIRPPTLGRNTNYEAVPSAASPQDRARAAREQRRALFSF